jgi:hypothetical protein
MAGALNVQISLSRPMEVAKQTFLTYISHDGFIIDKRSTRVPWYQSLIKRGERGKKEDMC